ncbi:ANAPC2 [Symbiodinium sp. CCMP2456]|nr:ANAPC2 [Symbiodinium sp. CCMP2456]
MFIKEYKEMLADRLLANPTYHAEREMQNLELLKTRFGDAALVHCEVMLQDIKDSKRINGNVQQLKGTGGPLGPIHPLVLSQHYWPPALSKADHPRFRLPAQLEDALSEYGHAYTKTKAKRSLQWQRAHGVVEITVHLADRTLDVTVTPIHYAVLACFSEAPSGDSTPTTAPTRLSLEELTSQLELPEALVRKRVAFWVAKGVLKEVSASLFELQESAPSADGVNVDLDAGHLDDDTESPGPPLHGASREACSKELRACESFLQGMLKNYTTLSLSRIHNFLQRFMMEPAYTQSEAQLREFLAQLVQQGTLEFDGSSYALAQAAVS